MKRLYTTLSVITALILAFTSCYYDNEETLYPSIGGACDTTNITFSGAISSILANNCSTCHSNTTAAGFGAGITLENYADVKARATSVLGAIKQTVGFSPMPKNGGKLTNCLITQFDIWVRLGMPNN